MKTQDTIVAHLPWTTLARYCMAVQQIDPTFRRPVQWIGCGHSSITLQQVNATGAVLYLRAHNIETVGTPVGLWVPTTHIAWRSMVGIYRSTDSTVTFTREEVRGEGNESETVKAVPETKTLAKMLTYMEKVIEHPSEVATPPSGNRTCEIADLHGLTAALDVLSSVSDGSFQVSYLSHGYLALRCYNPDYTLAAAFPPKAS